MGNRIELTEYIGVDHLQRIQNSFSDLVGVGAAISDENGSAITSASGMCDFCKYTRVSSIGNRRCRQCDSEGAEKAFQEGKPVSYTCHAGLVDFVSPIIIDGQRVGCFVGGQVRLGELDEEKIKQTAVDIGVNPMMYLALAKQTPAISEETLQRSMAFIHNVTESISDMAYKQYQIEKAKQEVEYAAKLKSDFLANMSHEIRTPMNGVIGLTELALREDMSEEVRSYLNQIRVSGKSLMTIINDILDFSKIESGKMEIIPDSYDLKTLVDEVVDMLKPKANEKGLALFVETNPEMPYLLNGDAIRIKQVVTNLVNNAVKFTKTGSVTIVLDGEKTDDSKIELSVKVKDTGIGITPEDIQKLFKSFQQVDSKRNRQVEGTGLGLAISKQLIQLMDGNIGVESTYGEGSCFYFQIPQKVDDWTPLRDRDIAEVAGSGEDQEMHSDAVFVAPTARILIVDDNEVNLTVAAGLLGPLKMKIDTALSGKQALEMVEKTEYDLIFMDHMMPDMDGIETTHEIRDQFPQYQNIPIIALTANIMAGNKEMFLEEGLNDFVGKPIDFKLIISKLHKWLPKDKQEMVDHLEREDTENGEIKIESLDTEYAIGILGTQDLFFKVLRDYYRVIEKKAALIQEYYEKQEWKSYIIEVHALKSASRQIGALALSSLAESLEKAGNEGKLSLIQEKTEDMLKQYVGYLDILATYCDNKESESKKETIDSEKLAAYLQEMAEACDDLDMVRMQEIMETLGGYTYTQEQQELISSLEEASQNMDVDTCLELIEQFERR